MPTNNRPTVEINGYALRCIRKLMNVTPRELAGQIGRDRTYVVHIESGTVKRVSTETYDALIAALGLEDARALAVQPHAVTLKVAA